MKLQVITGDMMFKFPIRMKMSAINPTMQIAITGVLFAPN